ncbi:MAG: 4-hydroxy-tetrahydrodipicolinate reductase [Bacteroidia bacterium]|nr:4-hydroxy-tetrahydrodipicolinate reductase [Bacteroidia bacterium]MCF8427498.1 4-hydroxy-tetrahydrodipicolinate reductase [Bacteroidia bacterium]MCF8447747.1 4-hydroxy-tetrahydrodipicolinate reductase [Bacteroidia bacterium]
MKIALLGYGKMGMAIEKVAVAKGHEIVYKVNLENAYDFMPLSLKNVDVAIDFSMPTAAVDNILKCFEVGIPIVVGTTGWYDQFDEIKAKCLSEGQAMVHSTNFSIGVNLFYKLNKIMASMMAHFDSYNVMIEEVHHTAKKDHPSGTALSLASHIMKEIPSKTTIRERLIYGDDQPSQSVKPHELLIETYREGDVTGLHKVKYESVIDSIEIIHDAKSRYGFAKGAVMAAEWIIGKKGIYTMDDILNLDEILK